MAIAPNKEKSNKEVERIEKIIDGEIEKAPDQTTFNIPASLFTEKSAGTNASLPIAQATKNELVKRYTGEGWTVAKFDNVIDSLGSSVVFTLEA